MEQKPDATSVHQMVAEYLNSGELCDEQLIQLLIDHPQVASRLRQLLTAHDRSLGTLPNEALPAASGTNIAYGSGAKRGEAPTLPPGKIDTGALGQKREKNGTEDTLAATSTSERAPAPTTATTFGDYWLHDEIARGGMGVIYRAHQISLDRPVALKMILAGQLAGPSDIARFRTEAESAAQLNHRGIVPIYEVGEQDGQHFFAMGLVNGSSLADRIEGSPLKCDEAASLVKEIAEAVGYAHQQGVVHRDLKPANVLIDADGTPLVTDFGIAKRVNKDSQLTNDGQVLGTPSYMPPEQASGQIEKVGPASDIYSIGAILFASITGRPPFQAATPLETLMLVLERDPTLPSQLNPEVDADLETICLKCLQKDPEQRYASTEDFIADLARYERGEPLAARPVSPVELLWRYHRRLRHHKTVRVRSTQGIGRLPWVDIAIGPDQESGESHGTAKGMIAIGDRALGVIALGNSARGFIALGGSCVGVFAFGSRVLGVAVFGAIGVGVISFSGLSIGLIAFGAVALGRVAVGGIAIGIYSFGALAIGSHGMGIGRNDPVAQEFFSVWIRRLFGWFR